MSELVVDGVRNGVLAAHGRREIAHCTPHTLRRTYASILAEVNLPPRRAIYLLGHTDPTLTMRVYQQVIDMREGGVQTLEQPSAALSPRLSHCFPGGVFGTQ